ncbi:teichuronic acid biosynthesis protein [Gracilibacillus halophilus YIM-C55.5]|uniref:Teichuronic acid biosynthesis protein n=1 Tax=Gracilibacillus halophilus YIM-C55.5 TaxID=1308866 RepID=N4W8J1_9BACI|nr:glycosyltransferase family 2 protein [Gracilibacillus halophilus]ENH96578.1 teichuronic acid biosynthesis protein [Gracilibacillus halophilus YIM-C55.5]
MSEYVDNLISVITPTYNSEAFIEKTMESVRQQTYSNWEMVIVDDGSTDDTISIIQKYQEQDERIKFIQLTENQGAAIARNTAIEHAKGRFIAFLDSDDQWMPEKLEEQLAFMQENDIAFSYTGYQELYEDEEKGNVITAPQKADYPQLLKNCVIGCLTVIIDRYKTGKLQMVNIRSRQDYALWLELTRKGYIAYGLDRVLSLYRVREQSISSNKIKMAKQNWYVYRNVEKLGFFKSVWYFIQYAYFKIRKYIV